MRIVFFGSGEFAISVLESLLLAGYEVACVVTQGDKQAGRNLEIRPTPIKKYALAKNIAVLEPPDLSSADVFARLKNFNADLFIVVQYGIIIPKQIIDLPKIFSLNIHASLLPKYRGAAPINWAIINGETETGISIIRMNEFMDKGDLILKQSLPINDSDDAQSLGIRLSVLAARLILEALELIKKKVYKLTAQNEIFASYIRKLSKQDGLIDWNRSSRDIFNQVRGLISWPVAYTYFNHKMLKIWKSQVFDVKNYISDKSFKSGEVVDITPDAVVVFCLDSFLAIEEVQLESAKRMSAYSFAIGHKIKKGDFLVSS